MYFCIVVKFPEITQLEGKILLPILDYVRDYLLIMTRQHAQTNCDKAITQGRTHKKQAENL